MKKIISLFLVVFLLMQIMLAAQAQLSDLIISSPRFMSITTTDDIPLIEETEDFEDYDTVEPVTVTTSGNETGWKILSGSEAFAPEIKDVEGNNLISVKSPQAIGGSGTPHDRVDKALVSNGITGIFDYSFRIKIPSGIDNGLGGTFNTPSGAQPTTGFTNVSLRDKNNANIEMGTFYFTQRMTDGTNKIEVKFCGANEAGGDSDITHSAANQRYPLDTWINVTATFDTASKKVWYTVTDGTITNYVAKENAFFIRKHKDSAYTGNARDISIYNDRSSKNLLAYVDNFSLKTNSSVYETIEIGAPKVGTVRTDINVANTGFTPQSACLIVALYDDVNKRLEKIDTDYEEIGVWEDKTLSAQLKIDSLEGYSYKYFLWNSLDNMTPTEIPLNAPFNLQAVEGLRKISLTWDDLANGDKFREFIVYRDGIEIVRTKRLGYTDFNVKDGMNYRYSVSSYSKTGLVSDLSAEVSATPKSTYYISFDNPDKSYGLEHFSPAEVSYNETASRYEAPGWDAASMREYVNGRNVRTARPYYRLDKNNTAHTNLYFRIDNNLTEITKDDRNITFEVTYLDIASIQGHSFTIEYNYYGPDLELPGANLNTLYLAKRASWVVLENSGVWKTAKFTVPDACFRKPTGLNSSDFRIIFASGSVTCISRVAVYKTSEYVDALPSHTLGVNAEASALSYVKGNNISVTHIGTDSDKATANEPFIFNVSDANIADFNGEPYLYLKYCGNNAVTINYMGKDDTSKQVTMPSSGGNWVTAFTKLINAKLANSLDGNDFKITSTGDLYMSDIVLLPFNNEAVSIDFNTNTNAGITFALYEDDRKEYDAHSKPANIGGRSCRMTGTYVDGDELKNKYLYFSVDDNFIYGKDDSSVEIEFSYYDNGTKTLRIEYGTEDGSFIPLILGNKTNTNQWLTKKATLPNASLKNGQGNYRADFRLSIVDEKVGNIDHLYVSGVKVARHKESVFAD